VQHPFIRDVNDMHPLIELVSEANAEVVYEEKDIDEVVSILTLRLFDSTLIVYTTQKF